MASLSLSKITDFVRKVFRINKGSHNEPVQINIQPGIITDDILARNHSPFPMLHTELQLEIIGRRIESASSGETQMVSLNRGQEGVRALVTNGRMFHGRPFARKRAMPRPGTGLQKVRHHRNNMNRAWG